MTVAEFNDKVNSGEYAKRDLVWMKSCNRGGFRYEVERKQVMDAGGSHEHHRTFASRNIDDDSIVDVKVVKQKLVEGGFIPMYDLIDMKSFRIPVGEYLDLCYYSRIGQINAADLMTYEPRK